MSFDRVTVSRCSRAVKKNFTFFIVLLALTVALVSYLKETSAKMSLKKRVCNEPVIDEILNNSELIVYGKFTDKGALVPFRNNKDPKNFEDRYLLQGFDILFSLKGNIKNKEIYIDVSTAALNRIVKKNWCGFYMVNFKLPSEKKEPVVLFLKKNKEMEETVKEKDPNSLDAYELDTDATNIDFEFLEKDLRGRPEEQKKALDYVEKLLKRAEELYGVKEEGLEDTGVKEEKKDKEKEKSSLEERIKNIQQSALKEDTPKKKESPMPSASPEQPSQEPKKEPLLTWQTWLALSAIFALAFIAVLVFAIKKSKKKM